MSHLYVRSMSALRGAALVALTLLLTSQGVLAAEPAREPEAASAKTPETRLVGVVNVNTATPDELGLLPGVGPVRAQAIVERRKEVGGFKSVEDLKAVKGIGDRALERIRAHVSLDGKTTARLVR